MSDVRSVVRRLYRGETRINFIGSRRRWYLASLILITICILSFIFRGFNYGVEFKGGTQFQLPVTGTSITTTQVETTFRDAGVAPAEPPQKVGSGATNQIVVKTQSLTPAQSADLKAKIASALGIAQNKITVQSVSSSWGHNITVKAIEGLIVFLIVVSIYIAIRYQWRMAAAGIVALLHDLIVAGGVYSLVGFEVTPSTVVGLLTILGFSLYDTVVVFDKVAENTKDITAGSRMTYSEAANMAVNQTLMRSINTSLIALLPVAGLLFVGAGILGVGTIKDLALILFVGLASGAYSSLFLATPVVVELTEREPQYKALTKRVVAKRNSEAAKAATAAQLVPAGASAAPARVGNGLPSTNGPRRAGGPAPAPRPGARPQRPKRK
ncbi:MAG: preprotein translocase subunit SecF [Pseudonocardiales bacterium]|jgi:preprotein translocase subunit SecF|nr:Protein-export rane protein SecF [Pseudonocardiales bacterium]MDT4962445.1 preprotein translocase subunit SecF [Pseudonocardiales bacterium]MDT4969995.1 preprotein translocase subunit SecF [Pseudonocardiales bacterium]MDT4979284.1 preprotein translocase subunit SecF [Pseudonocardiales bacterium]